MDVMSFRCPGRILGQQDGMGQQIEVILVRLRLQTLVEATCENHSKYLYKADA